MDPTSPTSPICHPDPVMKKSLAIQEPAMCSSPKGSNPATYSSIPESDYHNIVSHLLDVDDELILEQLDHYVNELSSDWKGKLMYPCHVIYDLGDATFPNSTLSPL